VSKFDWPQQRAGIFASNNKVKDVRAKTPLAEVFYFLPGNGARKTADAPS
jgi:hypothetical protein